MSSNCHDEHHSHADHDHSHANGHNHSDDIAPALQYSLYPQISFDTITTLNESVPNSGKAIIKKTWAERTNTEIELCSDCDPQLLIHIPFTSQIKLHSILIHSSASPCAPRTLKIFVNRSDLDFSSASELPPTQILELSQTEEVQDVPVKRALFGKVQSLTLFVEDNFDGGEGEEEVTRVGYLGFRGEWMVLGRAPTNILYEAAANPSDHKIKGTAGMGMGSQLGQ